MRGLNLNKSLQVDSCIDRHDGRSDDPVATCPGAARRTRGAGTSGLSGGSGMVSKTASCPSRPQAAAAVRPRQRPVVEQLPAAAAGAAGRSRTRSLTEPPNRTASVPRIPNDPAYGVQAGKPDFGGLAKGVWNVPYIVNLQTDAHDENGCRFIQIPFKPAAKAIWEERFLKNDMKDDPEGFCLPPGVPAHDVHAVSRADLSDAGSHRVRL